MAARRWIAAGLAVSIASASLGAVARQRSEADPEHPVRAATAASSVAASGMVVSLLAAATSGQPVQAGVEQGFYVDVLGTEPIAAVELWVGDAPVAREVLARADVEHASRLAWTPSEPGDALVVARALDVQGREAQSNPVALRVVPPSSIVGYVPLMSQAGDTLAAVAEREAVDVEALRVLNPDVPADATIPVDSELIVPRMPTGPMPIGTVGTAAAREPEDEPSLPPLPTGVARATAPSLRVDTGDCSATVTAAGDDVTGDVVLWEMGPAGESMVPVVELEVGGEPTRVAIGPGVHTFVASRSVDGATRAWSALVGATGQDDCAPGWTGEVAIVDGVVAADGTGVDHAYLYVSSGPGQWVRVPEEGFVPRTPSGFDFSEHLPDLSGSFQVEAWGWANGALVPLGEGAFTPQQAEPSRLTIDGLPEITLRWYEPNEGTGPETLSTGGEIESIDSTWGEQRFRWSTPLPGVTSLLVQVSHSTFAEGAGPRPDGLVLQHTLANPAQQGTFGIDFDALEVIDFRPGVDRRRIASSDAVDAHTGYGDVVVLDESLFGPPATASETQPDLDPLDDFPLGGGNDFVVRVVPLISDQYLGVVSNEVALTLDSSPEPQDGESSYELDVELTKQPTPPDLRYATCWQFRGWTDDAAVAAALAQEDVALADNPLASLSPTKAMVAFRTLYPYRFWTWFLDNVGSDTPICGGCWSVHGARFALAGGECQPETGFVDAVFGGFKQLVSSLSRAWSALKAAVVKAVVTATGCTELGDAAADVCGKVAEVALNAALVAVGVPPSLPDWEQLVALAEGEIAALGVALLSDLGVPCDESTVVAQMSDTPELTCEGAIKAMLGEGMEQIQQLHRDTGNAMGFGFPPLMKVEPHPRGQVGPAEVKLTISPTKFSASAGGKTCSALVTSSSSWAPKPYPTSLLGTPRPIFFSTDVVIPASVSQSSGEATSFFIIRPSPVTGTTFDKIMLRLPDLPFDPAQPFRYGTASKTYLLYPPADWDPVLVGGFSKGHGSASWRRHPYHWSLLHVGAELKLGFLSSCASTEFRTWRLQGVFGAPLVASS